MYRIGKSTTCSGCGLSLNDMSGVDTEVSQESKTKNKSKTLLSKVGKVILIVSGIFIVLSIGFCIIIMNLFTSDEYTPIDTLVLTVMDKQKEDSIIYSSRILTTEDGILGYTASSSYVPDSEGGSYSYTLSAYITSDDVVIYHTSNDTTGDNGYTVKYICDRSIVNTDTIRAIINEEDWENLYETTDLLLASYISKEVVSMGMNDEASRTENGSYKWYVEYINLLSDAVHETINVD